MLTLDEFWSERFAARYEAAVAAEATRRTEAFLDVPRTVAGEELRVMTPNDLHVLDGFDNAFVCGGTITLGDLEMFLWMLNTRNRPGPLNGLRYWRFARRLVRLDYSKAAGDVIRYLDFIFADSAFARPVKKDGEETESAPKIGLCFLAPLVVSVCSGLGGIHPNDVRRMPLPQVFAYRKAIAGRTDPNFQQVNASEKIKSDCLEAYNLYIAEQNAATAA